ncbi:MAG: hypothetical protein IPJ65_04105 [Archangiaceae bacterium]|nr:hypothetical protein [Archangiaceae bacterium]
MNATYVWAEPYISPTVAPPLFDAHRRPSLGSVPSTTRGSAPSPRGGRRFFRSRRPSSPGLAIAFRFTCYYYRGAYYKAFFVRRPTAP